MYAAVLIPVWLAFSATVSSGSTPDSHSLWRWNLGSFYPGKVDKLVEGSTQQVFWALPENYSDPGAAGSGGGLEKEPFSDELALYFESSDKQVADVTANDVVYLNASSYSTTRLNVSLAITGQFLGHAKIRVSVASRLRPASRVALDKTLDVAVVRKDTILDKIFLYSVIGLVSLAYINMGCSLDLKVVWNTIRRPVAPLVGISCQYLCMPLVSTSRDDFFVQYC
jgi:hypothetical protein